ncbi:hypothetical protein [Streptomyces sp. NPDC096132]|uniref:hypothetical protein n=1 Tax=Streptomyces sp. NPDC096132 TaxID=3366075 RepID=UPI0037FD58C6
MTQLLPGDLVRVRVIGGEQETERLLRGLAEETSVAKQLTPIPAIEVETPGSFGVVDVVQDFIVGVGAELTGAAVAAAVQAAVARFRKADDACAGELVPEDLSVQAEPVVSVLLEAADAVAEPGRRDLRVVDRVTAQLFPEQGSLSSGKATVPLSSSCDARVVSEAGQIRLGEGGKVAICL